MKNYQVMPPLSEEEYADLKADIAARGVMVPIEVDEEGNVLDGHHRLQICRELGITDYPVNVRTGLTEEEKWTHAIQLNVARRQLSAEQKREIIQQQIKRNPAKSDRQIAREVHADHHTVAAQRAKLEAVGEIPHLDTSTGADGKEYSRHRQTATGRQKIVSVFNPTEREERTLKDKAVVERMRETGSTSPVSTAQRIAAEQKAARKAYTLPGHMPESACTLFHADIRDGLPQAAANSVDAIITEPPAASDAVPLYGSLAGLAARVLKPGGSLLVVCDKLIIPDVLEAMDGHGIQYYWICLLLNDFQRPAERLVNTRSKNVLHYVKDYYNGDRNSDIINNDSSSNPYHNWPQPLGTAAELVNKFTDPGQTVLDPFMGGGTTGAAAVVQARRFIGADIDQAAVDAAEKRIAAEYAAAVDDLDAGAADQT